MKSPLLILIIALTSIATLYISLFRDYYSRLFAIVLYLYILYECIKLIKE